MAVHALGKQVEIRLAIDPPDIPSAPLPELTPAQLRRLCEPSRFDFADTSQIGPTGILAGQDRAQASLDFGLGIAGPGFNIYAMGPPGTGRRTGVLRALRERAREGAPPDDWCYVNNFAEPQRPEALALPAGRGEVFRQDMAELVHELEDSLTRAFEGDAYTQQREGAARAFQEAQAARFGALEQAAASRGFAIARSEAGPRVAPQRGGELLTAEAFAALPTAEQQRLEAEGQQLQGELQQALRASRAEEKALRAKLAELDKQISAVAVAGPFDELEHDYAAFPEVIRYLQAARRDVLENIALFRAAVEAPAEAQVAPAGPAARAAAEVGRPVQQLNPRVRYGVNVLVDNGRAQGQPVIVETNPTYRNLIGRIEPRAQMGTLVTDFTLIKAGALLRANGGYLVVEIQDVLRNPPAWAGLKRALKAGCLRIEDLEDNQRVLGTGSPEPEAIPLSVKVVLLGDAGTYYALFQTDQEFAELFKVRAEFTPEVERTSENERMYAMFIAGQTAEERLRPFDAAAVAKVIEHGARLAEDQGKLTAQFGMIADLVREADFWTSRRGGGVVNATDVRAAVEAKEYRANLAEQLLRKSIDEGTILVDTAGAVVGQVNGLSVLTLAEHAFGRPARITARTFLGRAGIVNIEREVLLGGRIHNKGVLILGGYLGGKYARDKPLSLSASLSFEQLYDEIEGDSASSAELYALLSSLADLPIRQALAVTGSVNQRGEVQPVGGVNEKIEGFFDLCRLHGLSGEQGVLIPERNVRSLMLREDVVAAVAEGQFHIYPVRAIDEGIERLTGLPAGVPDAEGRYPLGSVNRRVDDRLRELAERWREFRWMPADGGRRAAGEQ
jgi:predicted ATP-dependent protease